MSQDEPDRPPTPHPSEPEGRLSPYEEAEAPPPLLDTTPRRGFADTFVGAVLLGILAFVVWVVVTQFLPGIIVVIRALSLTGEAITTRERVLEALTVNLPAVLGLAAVFSAAMVWSLKTAGWLAPAPQSTRPLRAKVIWTAVATVACLAGSFLIAMLLHALGHEVKEQQILVDAAAQGGILFALAGIVAAPIGEELGVRRLMFSTISRGAGRVAAYVLTAVCFALIHDNPSAFPLYVWMGLCFAFAYDVTGSVWASIFVHAANNTFALLIGP